MIRTEPVRGMKDYVGIEAKEIRFLEDVFRKTVELSNYIEVISPIIEEFSLFAMKGGEELRRTMYTFKDKAERELSLRPEITPSIARVFLDKLQPLPRPIKLYYIGTVYRYDEPQNGRYREFRQAGVEVLGAEGPLVDTLVINDLYTFFNKIGMGNIITIKLNNISIIRRILEDMAINEGEQEHILHLIDKGLFDDAVQEIDRLATSDKKNMETMFEIIKAGTISEVKLKDYISYYKNLSQQFIYLKQVYEMSKNLGIPVKLDMSLVRGLAYYTGIIFEVKTENVQFSIAGGGRYDRLIEIYGGPHTPAVGFAVGIERTLIAGKGYIKISQLPKIIIFNLTSSCLMFSISIAGKLRENGYIAEIDTKGGSLGKAIPSYISQGFRIMIIIGEKEVREGNVTVKDLDKKTQVTVAIDKLLDLLKQML
ncbi:histidine--tRNA ligase [Sulfuracidifex metallicus]|uniref:histidine--tRNA ligase n=1 Tax=Sulfuracidifex metallicus TaxID=47303 RepID=UPI0022768DC8|nr:histidine--tRNA ligase [Sulfuracidifex metallicus]MCY0850125.1 histidine--tRNA ligase [Sulfuracidifex metallicus]